MRNPRPTQPLRVTNKTLPQHASAALLREDHGVLPSDSGSKRTTAHREVISEAFLPQADGGATSGRVQPPNPAFLCSCFHPFLTDYVRGQGLCGRRVDERPQPSAAPARVNVLALPILLLQVLGPAEPTSGA